MPDDVGAGMLQQTPIVYYRNKATGKRVRLLWVNDAQVCLRTDDGFEYHYNADQFMVEYEVWPQ